MQKLNIDYHETGTGETVLFLPGSFSTHHAWRELESHIIGNYRCVSTSLCGYGKTEETRSSENFGMHHEINVVQAAIEHTQSPVHLVGHSFGGAIAFAAALSGVPNIRSITTFEGNPLAILRDAGHEETYHEIQRISLDFERTLQSGSLDAAAQIIDFWGREGAFNALPKPVQDYCRASAKTNALDWRTAFSYQATAADYSRLSIPTCLVRGSEANPEMKLITEILHNSLPISQFKSVPGAGHFLIHSHAEECADILLNFLKRGKRGRRD